MFNVLYKSVFGEAGKNYIILSYVLVSNSTPKPFLWSANIKLNVLHLLMHFLSFVMSCKLFAVNNEHLYRNLKY